MLWRVMRGPDFEAFPSRVRRRVEQMLKRSRLERMSGTRKSRPVQGTRNTPWYLKDPKVRQKAEQQLRARMPSEMISSSRCLEEVQQAQEFVRECGLEDDRILRDLLVEKYRELGCVEISRSMLDSWLKRSSFSWSVLLAAFALNGDYRRVVQGFSEMISTGVNPSKFTFCVVLRACSELGRIEEAMMIHEAVLLDALPVDESFWNCLLETYLMMGKVAEARSVFQTSVVRDLDWWRAMICGFARLGQPEEALEYFKMMDLEGRRANREILVQLLGSLEGRPELLHEGRMIEEKSVELGFREDVQVCVALLKMYSRCGSLQDARFVFERINRKDSASWTAMIVENVRHSAAEAALDLFRELDPDACNDGTLEAAVTACTLLGNWSLGMRIHQQVQQVSSGKKLDLKLGAALMLMYSKMGELTKVVEVFESVESWFREENVWNALMEAYARAGHVKQVLVSLREMDLDGLRPDERTMLSVLGSLGNSGLLLKCREYFRSIASDRGLELLPEHYECMVEALARKGQVKSAEELVGSMPFEPTSLALQILSSNGNKSPTGCQ